MDLPTSLHNQPPSLWVRRFAPLIRTGGHVLDLACGAGRHASYLAALGCIVDAVDRDEAAISQLGGNAAIRPRCADLEAKPWPYGGRVWDAIVVTNYLHRPLFPALIASLAREGVLIYETFMEGNERFGKPSRPDFLLRPYELLDAFGKALAVVAFEQGETIEPRPAVVQRLCAVRSADVSGIKLTEWSVPSG